MDYQTWHANQKAAQRRSMKLLYQTRRAVAIALYGGKCGECGNQQEDDLMIVPEHGTRWGVSRTGKKITGNAGKMAWLDRNDYPPGFRVICRRGLACTQDV